MPPVDEHDLTERTKALHVYSVVAVNAVVTPHPANPRRNYLLICNTGLNVGYLRFGQPPKATTLSANGDIPIAAGQSIEWAQRIPIESVNLSAPVGATTFTTIEGLPLEQGRPK